VTPDNIPRNLRNFIETRTIVHRIRIYSVPIRPEELLPRIYLTQLPEKGARYIVGRVSRRNVPKLEALRALQADASDLERMEELLSSLGIGNTNKVHAPAALKVNPCQSQSGTFI
jgi:hypothetical protein